jgi:hypothetical protein
LKPKTLGFVLSLIFEFSANLIVPTVGKRDNKLLPVVTFRETCNTLFKPGILGTRGLYVYTYRGLRVLTP